VKEACSPPAPKDGRERTARFSSSELTRDLPAKENIADQWPPHDSRPQGCETLPRASRLSRGCCSDGPGIARTTPLDARDGGASAAGCGRSRGGKGKSMLLSQLPLGPSARASGIGSYQCPSARCEEKHGTALPPAHGQQPLTPAPSRRPLRAAACSELPGSHATASARSGRSGSRGCSTRVAEEFGGPMVLLCCSAGEVAV